MPTLVNLKGTDTVKADQTALVSEITRSSTVDTAQQIALDAQILKQQTHETNAAARLGISLTDPDWGDRAGTNYDNVATLTALIDQIITALENLNVTGQPVSPYADTFAGLPAVPVDTDGDAKKYWTVLTKNDIGTGDADNPQYSAGIYLTGATAADGWQFSGASFDTEILEIEDVQLQDKTDTTVGMLKGGKQLHDWYLNTTGYDPIPADGQLLAGASYSIAINDPESTMPTNRPDGTPLQFGDWVTLRNSIPLLDGFNLTLNGPVKLSVAGNVANKIFIPTGFWLTFTWDGAQWESPSNIQLVVPLSGATSGITLTPGHKYVIDAGSAGVEYFMPERPYSSLDIRLSANSLHGAKIRQSAAVTASHQMRLEGATVDNAIDLEVAYKGQLTTIEGDATYSGGRWNVFRQWKLDELNNNSIPWQPLTLYKVDALVQAVKPGTAITYLYSRIADGTSTGVFDATEEADWIELGKAPVTLPVLETLQFTVRGYLSSWTSASELVLTDGTGTDYNMADWIIIEDTLSAAIVGQSVLGKNFSPPANNTRTVKIQYNGGAQRQGLSALRFTFRAPAATTGLINVVPSFYDGRTVTPYTPPPALEGPLAGEQTFDIDPDWDFLTHATVTQISEVNYTDLELGVANSAGVYLADAPAGTNSEDTGTTYLVELLAAETPPDPLTAAWWDDRSKVLILGQYSKESDLPDWSAKEWKTGAKVIAPMPVNADFITNDGAIAGVKYIFEALNDRPDTVTAFDDTEVDAGNWRLIGQFQINGTDDRVLTGAGIMGLDPLATLSNSAKNEFIHWTTLDDAIDVLFGFNPNSITQWKDYTGAGLIQPTAVNDVITIPADSQMWVHRAGNALTFTFESNVGGGGVTNALVYPVGSFVALPVNDGATGENGAVYWLPTVDALEITLPDKATMGIATGIYRVQISADWAGLAAQTTPLSFIDDTANGLSMGEGFPVEGQETIDLFIDPAGDRWILTSGDRATLDQITPSYDEFAEVPLTVRQFLMTGNGAPAEGSYRRQVADNQPQLIG